MNEAPTSAPPAGAIPPQNLEAEESVLGAMMISPLAIAAVRDTLNPDDFYRPSHGIIYKAALALHDAGDPVDAITLTGELEQRGHLDQAGGRTRLFEIANLVPASANAAHYAEIVRDAATLRSLISLGSTVAQLGWDREGTPGDLVERARLLFNDHLERGTAAGTLDVETWASFERSATEQIPLLVDQLWPVGALGFVSAPPKKGKTWVGLSLALSVATGQPFLGRFDVPEAKPVVYLALEGHRAAIRGRIGCLARGLGLDPHKPIPNLHIVYKPRGLNLNDPRWVQTVRQAIEQLDAHMLIVDVLRRAAILKENSNEEFAAFLHQLDPIAAATSVVLLHHFGKLTEISRDRSPGERMAGAGAMYGALDVGLYITGSDDGGRRLRIEFESRDLAAPDTAGVYLEGDPTGPNGGFVFTDKAWWTATAEAPEADDVKAPSEEIAQYVRDQGGEVERRIVEAHFDISRDTLTKRLTHLRALGVELVVGRGRGAQSVLRAAPIEAPDPQLEIPAESCDFSCDPESCESQHNGGRSFTGLEQAENSERCESCGKVRPDRVAGKESGHMQGDFCCESCASPKGEEPAAKATALPQEPAATTPDHAHDDDLELFT